MTLTDEDLRRLGLSWNGEGSVGLAGPLLRLFCALDEAFVGLARSLGAEEQAFVPLIAARDLRRIDYFSSFPHLCTLPVTVEPGALEAFRRANAADGDGPLAVG